ncbi:MAG: PAS domain-containing hybrid sensor histidine kinase/response regulator [Betaproteobacteria bacterium]|nr:PAS domain-containing hybrid sensor histidine kinase/response regulator [Betaproteobacteria bacterium]
MPQFDERSGVDVRSWIDAHRQRQAVGPELTLAETERRMRRIEMALDVAREVVWEFDVPTRTLVHTFSHSHLKGMRADEMPRSFDELLKVVHEDDHARILQAERDHLSGRRPEYLVDYRLLTPDGSASWVRLRGRVVEWDEQGRPLKMVGTSTGITEYKLLEEQLRRSQADLREAVQKAESLAQAKSAFLAIMAHEIRTRDVTRAPADGLARLAAGQPEAVRAAGRAPGCGPAVALQPRCTALGARGWIPSVAGGEQPRRQCPEIHRAGHGGARADLPDR